jgi:AcrR family transcriptional regulator
MAKGQQTRETILNIASQMASRDGLEGLSIGKLAEYLSMSKSGIFAHFGSKEDLQTATLDYAWAIMAEHLTTTDTSPGLEQLRATLNGWLAYLEHSPFAGGCVFMAASTEFDGRPGKVHDHLLGLVANAVNGLLEQFSIAQHLGQLRPDIPAAQMVFEVHAFLQAANNAYQLSKDASYFGFARHAIESHLNAWKTSEVQ